MDWLRAPQALEEIADGAPFDSIEAIRRLAKDVTILKKKVAALAPLAPPDLGPAVDTPHSALVAIGLPEKAAIILAAAGYLTADMLHRATDTDLGRIDGIGPGTIALIRRKLTGK